MDKIVYIADIGGDIDDLVAIKYLNSIGALGSVVLDGASQDNERKLILERDGIEVLNEIPKGTDIVFCGGAFTKIAKYLQNNKLDLIVANGFFAGCNIVPPEHVLDKFKNLAQCVSYNPNQDYKSALEVVRSGVDMLIVAKNVCHHPDNTIDNWHDPKSVKIKIPARKKLHDLLMVKEGINFIKNRSTFCVYESVNIYMNKGNAITWRAEPDKESNILISLYAKTNKIAEKI